LGDEEGECLAFALIHHHEGILAGPEWGQCERSGEGPRIRDTVQSKTKAPFDCAEGGEYIDADFEVVACREERGYGQDEPWWLGPLVGPSLHHTEANRHADRQCIVLGNATAQAAKGKAKRHSEQQTLRCLTTPHKLQAEARLGKLTRAGRATYPPSKPMTEACQRYAIVRLQKWLETTMLD
jgi:hypothetical protein